MTKRYYYKCPIVALYMMQNFDVKLFDHSEEDLKILILRDNGCDGYDYDLEVRDESESIFLPKEGDLIDYGNGVGYIYDDTYEHCKIIMRNGKLFFDAEANND